MEKSVTRKTVVADCLPFSMNAHMNKEKLPLKLITGSFQNILSDTERSELDVWLSSPENMDLYSGLYDFWKSIRSDLSCYDPDGRRLWTEFIHRTRPERKRKTLFVRVAAAAAVLFIGVVSLYFVSVDHGDEVVTIASVSGKSRAVLPDGSVVWIKDGSSIVYDSRTFGKRSRPVSMDGEAYFEVAKNRHKVFSVSVDSLLVKVSGTSFNVKDCGSKVEISLVEGSVTITGPSGQTFSLAEGHKAEYDKCSRTIGQTAGDISVDVCWAGSNLSFKAQTLGDICRRLSVWYDVKIIPVESLESEYAYTFTVSDESLDEILGIMGRINPIKYEKDGNIYRITELR